METDVKVNVSLIIPVKHGEGVNESYLERKAVKEVRIALAEIRTESELEIINIAGIIQK